MTRDRSELTLATGWFTGPTAGNELAAALVDAGFARTVRAVFTTPDVVEDPDAFYEAAGGARTVLVSGMNMAANRWRGTDVPLPAGYVAVNATEPASYPRLMGRGLMRQAVHTANSILGDTEAERRTAGTIARDSLVEALHHGRTYLEQTRGLVPYSGAQTQMTLIRRGMPVVRTVATGTGPDRDIMVPNSPTNVPVPTVEHLGGHDAILDPTRQGPIVRSITRIYGQIAPGS
jgi:hypothetical protein